MINCSKNIIFTVVAFLGASFSLSAPHDTAEKVRAVFAEIHKASDSRLNGGNCEDKERGFLKLLGDTCRIIADDENRREWKLYLCSEEFLKHVNRVVDVVRGSQFSEKEFYSALLEVVKVLQWIFTHLEPLTPKDSVTCFFGAHPDRYSRIEPGQTLPLNPEDARIQLLVVIVLLQDLVKYPQGRNLCKEFCKIAKDLLNSKVVQDAIGKDVLFVLECCYVIPNNTGSLFLADSEERNGVYSYPDLNVVLNDLEKQIAVHPEIAVGNPGAGFSTSQQLLCGFGVFAAVLGFYGFSKKIVSLDRLRNKWNYSFWKIRVMPSLGFQRVSQKNHEPFSG